MKITIINGPNLNLLGIREPEVYGNETFETYLEKLKNIFPTIEFEYYQSNVEGELVTALQSAGFSTDGIILNKGTIVDASFVNVPRQRNSREENAQIKEGIELEE